MKTNDGIRGALARGYCTKENENKILDSELIEAMAVEVEKLLTQKDTEVAEVKLEERKAGYGQGYLQGRYDEQHGLERGHVLKRLRSLTPHPTEDTSGKTDGLTK